jgi:hypothetical protein
MRTSVSIRRLKTAFGRSFCFEVGSATTALDGFFSWFVSTCLAGVRMSVVGTFRTWRNVRVESAFEGKAEVGLRGRQVSF